jgi:hypothetical protein
METRERWPEGDPRRQPMMLSNAASDAATHRPFADSRAIPLGVDAPRIARGFVAAHLEEAATDVRDTARLLVSELVTNSVRHGHAARDENVVVRVRALPDGYWLEVEDPGHGGVIAPQWQDSGVCGLRPAARRPSQRPMGSRARHGWVDSGLGADRDRSRRARPRSGPR